MQKDDATWLRVAYVITAVLIAYIASKAFEMIGIQFSYADKFEWFGMASIIGSILLGAGITYWIANGAERHEYFLSSIAELRKVSWPAWPDVKRMTIVVCIVVGIFAVIVSAFDIVWAKALKLLIA